jgi:hypothetical protein
VPLLRSALNATVSRDRPTVGKKAAEIEYESYKSRIFFPPFQPQHHQFIFLKMSFAGRRRGNKVKKGVQFTVMVVGQCTAWRFWSLLLNCSQAPLALAVRLL